MNHVVKGIIICLLFVLINPLPSSAAVKPSDTDTIKIKGTVWFVSSMNLYGIMSEDGQKYHPIKKLPNEYMVGGLEVVVEGKLRDDLVGDKMWGKLLEVVKITKASKYIGQEDRLAIRLLLSRMDAFNSRSLAKLQNIDVIAKDLSNDQFNAWVAGYENYTLNYVDTSPEKNSTINGLCVYSRQPSNTMSLFDNSDYTVMKFVLCKTDGSWKFFNTEAYEPEVGTMMSDVIANLLEKGQQKYGTTDLTKWKG